MPWWGWLLIALAIVLIALLIWWFICRPRKKAASVAPPEVRARPAEIAPRAPSAAAPTAERTAPPAEAAPAAHDDLKQIEGIGPKIEGVLNAAGITTFAQLAATDVARLREILKAADVRIGYPDTWPEQAALAAAGKWDELKALQDQLQGGRRV